MSDVAAGQLSVLIEMDANEFAESRRIVVPYRLWRFQTLPKPGSSARFALPTTPQHNILTYVQVWHMKLQYFP